MAFHVERVQLNSGLRSTRHGRSTWNVVERPASAREQRTADGTGPRSSRTPQRRLRGRRQRQVQPLRDSECCDALPRRGAGYPGWRTTTNILYVFSLPPQRRGASQSTRAAPRPEHSSVSCVLAAEHDAQEHQAARLAQPDGAAVIVSSRRNRELGLRPNERPTIAGDEPRTLVGGTQRSLRREQRPYERPGPYRRDLLFFRSAAPTSRLRPDNPATVKPDLPSSHLYRHTAARYDLRPGSLLGYTF